MLKKIAFFLPAVMLFMTLLSATSKTQSGDISSGAPIQLIQFHSAHRCVTCNNIESLSRETIQNNPSITFSLINIDDEKNEKLVEQFEATGTALFLFDPKTKKKKDLTDFAFMNAGNKNDFIQGLKKEIAAFQK